MAIDFPNSPALNAYFESNGKAWTFNGTSWDIVQTPANLSIANASITGAKLASGAAVTNIGYTPANTASPTFTGTVVLPSDTSIGTITSTELGYVDGVTSAIQTQLNAKAPSASPTFTGTVTVSNDLTVSGDFTVSGTTTTINTETVTVNDNIIVLNNNASGAPTENAGIEIERGSSTNVQIRWNETTDKWQFTNDGSNYTDFGAGGATISDTAPASPEVGSLWFESDTAQTFVYYDSSWIEIGATAMGATVSTTAPNSPIGGQIWFNSDTGGTYVYYGSAWVEVGAAPVNLMLQAIDAKGDLLVGTADNAVDNLTVGANGSILMADSSQTNGIAWSTAQTSNRNVIINGDFKVWQRGTSISVANNNYSFYTADRWNLTNGAVSGNAHTVSRQPTSDTTNLPNIQYCARVQRNSGQTNTNGGSLCTFLETLNSISLAGKTVTFSFYARAGANFSPTSSILVSTIYTGTGVDQNNVTGTYTGEVATNTNHTLTTTWTRFTASVNTPSNMTEVAVRFLSTSTGTAGANDWYEVTGVQLEAGAVATPFEFEDIGTTLAKCQRYYQRRSGEKNYGLLTAQTGSNLYGVIPLPVSMRVAPTSVDAASLRAFDLFNGAQVFYTFGLDGTASTENMAAIAATATGFTAFRTYYVIHNGASSYLGFSAEL